jgi:hypothetical protein
MDGPANFKIGAGSLSIEGTDVGLTTEEGVVVTYEPDVHLHTSGKYGTTPVKASLVGQKLTIEIWIAEHTMENILNCYAGVTGSAGKVEFGGLAGREVEGKELVLTPFDLSKSWYFRNAVPVEAVDANFKVNDERIIHATFQALVDTDAADDDNLGYIS